MATPRLNMIRLDLLKWAIRRAGFQEREAMDMFKPLAGWLAEETLPTFKQLEDFARMFHVPIGYLFLKEPPKE